MEKNVGGMDRNIRFGAGAVLLILSLVNIINPGWLFGLIGIVLLATGYLNHCPAYKLIGMNTDKK
ncbi:MAG: hypothetical protein BWK73_36400 [Thiothrix lacustris]|uniref:Inner membrane protein YgaP-like transmembrane domain-containing protein n=1 Tax=Thiothrix lacustris TaxID=525917 RepID=A0A1Y1QFI0_9GAMM|nr:MAG: hypothetical protein BWK73_36400 [Thiothrix lacustris]